MYRSAGKFDESAVAYEKTLSVCTGIRQQVSPLTRLAALGLIKGNSSSRTPDRCVDDNSLTSDCIARLIKLELGLEVTGVARVLQAALQYKTGQPSKAAKTLDTLEEAGYQSSALLHMRKLLHS